jgi:hypothetical protein
MIYRILWIHGIFVKTYKQLLYSFYNLIIFYELVGGKQSYDLCGSLNLLICVGTLSTAFSIIEGANGFTIGNK